jgi:putative nucleotidyltransferase with HDIG domain
MRIQLTQDELNRFSPSEPGLRAHCVRVGALAGEIGRLTGIPLRSSTVLQQAALTHHSPQLAPNDTPLDRLLADVIGEEEAGQPVNIPESLAAILKAFHNFPARGVDATAEILTEILALANLIDEHIEGGKLEPPPAQPLWERLAPMRGMFCEHVWSAAQQLFPGGQGASPRKWEISVRPELAQELIGLVRNAASYSLNRLETIASRDPGIAGPLVAAANSPLFCSRARISSVPHAVAYLGENASRKIVTGLIARSMFGSSGALQALWRHSLQTAHYMENLARAKGFMDPAEALLTGLIHDVGRIAIVRQREAAAHERLVQAGGAPTWAETLLFGVDHAELSARILESWRFPESIVEAVRFHHQPADTGSYSAAALYVAEYWQEADEDLPSLRQLHSAMSRTNCWMNELSAFDAQDPAVATLLKIA